MRKRTIFAEGRAQLARMELRSAQATAADLTDKADILEVEVASLKSALAQRDTELATSKAQVLALKDYIANRYADEVQALDATHPLAEFQRAADVFESEGGNAGLSARQAADGHQAARAPASDNGRQESHNRGVARGVQSGSPDRGGDSTDSDDEDVHDGLARKRRRVSSAGPSRPLTSTATSSRRRHRPSSSSSGARARRQSPSSRSALAVPASSGPEFPVPSAVSALADPARSGPEVQPAPRHRRKTPAPVSAPAAALAVPASSGHEKPPGRSSWNSRSAQLPVAVPMASIAVAAAAASEPVIPASPSRKRKSPSPDSDSDANADDADAESSSDSVSYTHLTLPTICSV